MYVYSNNYDSSVTNLIDVSPMLFPPDLAVLKLQLAARAPAISPRNFLGPN